MKATRNVRRKHVGSSFLRRLGPGVMGGSSRQDSIRSGYVSDQEALASQSGPGPQQATTGQPLLVHHQPVSSVRSGRAGLAHSSPRDSGSVIVAGLEGGPGQDTRLCYLTSSEVSK